MNAGPLYLYIVGILVAEPLRQNGCCTIRWRFLHRNILLTSFVVDSSYKGLDTQSINIQTLYESVMLDYMDSVIELWLDKVENGVSGILNNNTLSRKEQRAEGPGTRKRMVGLYLE